MVSYADSFFEINPTDTMYFEPTEDGKGSLVKHNNIK